MATNNAFWNQLLMRSDSIADIDANAADAAEQVLAQLATVSEQFDRAFDPADQFEEYVAVNFCLALQKALTQKKTAPLCKVSVQHKIQSAQGTAVSTQNPQPAKQAKPVKAASPSGKSDNTQPNKKSPGGPGRRGKTG